ncbi:MAG TPA: PQQ-dependent sugar dehydrogenase [Lacibacter sp.]|nr:PQQ-dependent sugar dehydrogenase [Lacibacter sp.]
MQMFRQIMYASFILLAACSRDRGANPTQPPVVTPPLTGTPELTTTTLLTNQGIIWGFDVLPDGNLLYSQKAGTLRLFDTATRSNTPLTGLPTNISSSGQGGWLDVAVSPDFSTSRQVFVTYATTGGFLSLARFTLNGTAAANWQILHTTESASTWNGHFGSRLAFGADGKLYWSVGEGGGGSMGGPSSPHQNSQRLNTLWGKIHRMNPDGTVPADNPLLPGQTARSTIYSYGIRNPQGMAFGPGSGRLFASDHGPSGGCELNRIEAGHNYGWPLYSTGINYNGTTISSGHNAPGITPPLKSWTPALAPSGLTFINHPSFRDWNGNLLVGSLGRRHLLMISMANGVPGAETILLANIGRVRHAKMGPAGNLYVSVEDGGRLLLLTAR